MGFRSTAVGGSDDTGGVVLEDVAAGINDNSKGLLVDAVHNVGI
jgi:hypothetical protein